MTSWMVVSLAQPSLRYYCCKRIRYKPRILDEPCFGCIFKCKLNTLVSTTSAPICLSIVQVGSCNPLLCLFQVYLQSSTMILFGLCQTGTMLACYAHVENYGASDRTWWAFKQALLADFACNDKNCSHQKYQRIAWCLQASCKHISRGSSFKMLQPTPPSS